MDEIEKLRADLVLAGWRIERNNLNDRLNDEDTQREIPPLCPHCGDSHQVWRNQITGRWTCHRIHCYREIDDGR